jgi:WD40 repeat protein
LTASSDNRIIIWNPKTLQRETVLEGLTGLVGNVAVSPDGRTLACGGKQGLTIWDFKSRKARRFSGSTNWVTSVDFNPESTRLALGVRHPHVPGIYNKFTGQIIREEVLPYDEIEIWDVQQPRKLHTLGHLDTVGEVHYSSDGKFLASEGMCYVRLWEAKSGRALGVIRTNDQEIAYGFHFAFSPDGRFLATTYFSEEKNRGFVNIWATETLRQFPSAPKPRSSDP